MKLRMSKIVYAYDPARDEIRAVHVYVPTDDMNYQIVTSDDVAWVKQERRYTGNEWENLLYRIKESKADVKIVTALEEITP